MTELIWDGKYKDGAWDVSFDPNDLEEKLNKRAAITPKPEQIAE